MYAALWRILPGPTPVRILILLAVLDPWVFPWMAATFVDDQGTVGTPR
jgi:hypothetical protein